MRNNLTKLSCAALLALTASQISFADAPFSFATTAAAVDPYIYVTNESNKSYVMKYQGATVDNITQGFVMNVKNQGSATIPAHSKRKLAAHFYTITPDSHAKERSHIFYVALYNDHNQKVNEVQVVQHSIQQKCAIVIENTELVIGKNGLLTLVFYHPTKG